MKTDVFIEYGNVSFPVSASMPQDVNSLVKFLDARMGNGEVVRNLLVNNNGIHQIDVYQKGWATTTRRRIFLEKTFVEGRENCTRCAIFVFYPNKMTIGAAFSISPSQPTDNSQITTSHIEVKTTQEVYQRYQSAKATIQTGIAGSAFFGILGPALIGPVADIPAVACLLVAGAKGGEVLVQKIKAARSEQITVPDLRAHSLTALMQTSPNLAAVQNAIGPVVRRDNDKLWVYGFPVEQGRKETTIIIPESVTRMKVQDDKLLVWVGGEISQDGKRVLEAMSRESENWGGEKNLPVVRFIFPEMVTGIAESCFIDASKTF